ncbi:MAG: ABC transporter substrate-binding protein [Treponema sp.]|jgi:peptide/nickel transport system substrate-binding protein|nr:ABC transporter substrate-binding protein [Treponema sp.]
MKTHKIKKTALTAALAAVLALAFTLPAFSLGKRESGSTAGANSGESVEGGEIRFGYTTEPATLDPLSASNTADGRSILFNVFEGLVKPDTSGGLEPALAESYAIEQAGQVYIFTLRQGVKFHDGSDVTPEDVEFSLKTAIETKFAGLDGIDTVEITGDRKIRIVLKSPDVEYLTNLTVGIVPRNNPDREKRAIGTGPFIIESYTPQQSLVMVKNPNYWKKGLPHLDKVTYVFVADSDALLLALQGGSVDAGSVTGSLIEQLNPGAFTFVPAPSNSVQLLALNNAVKPLDDVRVRQALNYAVDRQEIIDAAFYGHGEPSGSALIPGLSRYYEPSLKNPYPLDIAKAKSLLAAAGYEKGFSLEITVPSNYTMHVDTAQVIVNQLAKIGVSGRIKLVDWPTWLSETYQGRQYEATIISVDAPTISPRGFLARYHSASRSNFVNFKSPDYDRVYDAVLVETDEQKRIELYQEAQRVLSAEAASVYIQDIIGFRAFPRNTQGIVSYPLYVLDFAGIYRTR